MSVGRVPERLDGVARRYPRHRLILMAAGALGLVLTMVLLVPDVGAR